MAHTYSKFKSKNIPYAKVGRRVFRSLYSAEEFCDAAGLDVDHDIEYREDVDLKKEIDEIAKYQKAILRECMNRLDKMQRKISAEISLNVKQRDTCHPLDRGCVENRISDAVGRHTGVCDARHCIWEVLEDLEYLTGWHD